MAFLLHLNYFLQALTFDDIQVTKCQQQLCPQQYYKVRKFEDFQAPALFSSTARQKKIQGLSGMHGNSVYNCSQPKS